MKVARHWTQETAEAVDPRGQKHRTTAWGWSSSSVEEAKRRARATAERVAQWLASAAESSPPLPSAQYLYCGDRPPREEIIQEFRGADGEIAALITRNSYGSLVLNCRDLMFVDIDFPPPPPGIGLLGRLFGKKPPIDNREAASLERVRQWCMAHADVGVRLYQTAAGLRLAIIDRPLDAGGNESKQLLAELGSDPLYRRLCDVQQCFRARLSPKPWRMKLDKPPARYPFKDATVEQRYRDWQRRYDDLAPRYATCRLLETHGRGEMHPELVPLLDLHDSLTGVSSTLPLA